MRLKRLTLESKDENNCVLRCIVIVVIVIVITFGAIVNVQVFEQTVQIKDVLC